MWRSILGNVVRPLMNVGTVGIQQLRHYKVVGVLEKRCEHCKKVKRQGVLRIICKENPRHKQRLMPVPKPKGKPLIWNL
jgi:large subunit ribosomal protein L36